MRFRKIISLIISFAILFTAIPAAFAEDYADVTYYVDSVNGDDSNDGLTERTAF